MKTVPCKYQNTRGEKCEDGKINDHFRDGYVSQYECPECKGSGRILKKEIMEQK